jgi:hypothetical protein
VVVVPRARTLCLLAARICERYRSPRLPGNGRTLTLTVGFISM